MVEQCVSKISVSLLGLVSSRPHVKKTKQKKTAGVAQRKTLQFYLTSTWTCLRTGIAALPYINMESHLRVRR